MRTVRYSRHTGEDAIDLEELVGRLADFLLESGFGNPRSEDLGDLYDAILEALRSDSGGEGDFRLPQRARSLLERLEKEGYIRTRGRADAEARFEVTNKAMDFLGYRTLKDLLGSLGRSSFGRHDTRELATGVEASGSAKPYVFGDTLNLDPSGTILNAIRRRGLAAGPIELEYSDLEIRQSEYQSSCATVLMLDCSHSMILYGEDRFTPAKKVALALGRLIRTQYPGDTLHVVLFHDSAEEIPLSALARVRVGPFYTNTCEGLKLARRILARENKDMRQIVMITDGKPSAVTEPDGSIYRNAFGLDPHVVGLTLRQVSQCRRSSILINTFMLARDEELVSFVRRVTEICRGKAYLTEPRALGRYILLDYMRKKVRSVH